MTSVDDALLTWEYLYGAVDAVGNLSTLTAVPKGIVSIEEDIATTSYSFVLKPPE